MTSPVVTPQVRVEMAGITWQCPRVLANDRARLTARAGEIHALVGENGAGKSTLMKVLYGVIRPDAGQMTVDGRPYAPRGPADAIHAGVGMVFQHFMLVESLTVAENLALGREPRRGRGPLAFLDRAAMRAEVHAVGERLGLSLDPDVTIERCSVGTQQRIEIAKVLLRGAEILVLDEPTAVLTPDESDALMATLRRLAGEGKAIILITHKLREVMSAADRVTIMRAGRTIDTLEVAKATAAEIAEKMIGHPVVEPAPRTHRGRGPPEELAPPDLARPELARAGWPGGVGPAALVVEGMTARSDRGPRALEGVTFTVERGEVLGVAGIEGNGQSELLQCLAGVRPIDAGRVRLAGHDISAAPPRARLELGLGHVPEDRHARALVLDLSVEENAILGSEGAFSKAFGLDFAAIRRHAEAIIRGSDVRPPDARAPVGTLSGGNQQKLVLGRELARHPKLLLAAHPTRGLDLFASRHVHAAITTAADGGAGVLLVSADLAELLALSDRIIVLFGGRIAGEVDPRAGDERALGLLMSGRAARGEPA